MLTDTTQLEQSLKSFFEQSEFDKTTEKWQKSFIDITLKEIDKPYQNFSDKERWVAAQEALENIITQLKARIRQ